MVATLIAAGSSVAAFLNIGNLAVLSSAVVGMLLFSGVNANTIGGWFGSLESKEADAGLGAWMNDRQHHWLWR